MAAVGVAVGIADMSADVAVAAESKIWEVPEEASHCWWVERE